MTITVGEKKSHILSVLAAVTRNNLEAAFGQNLTPVIEQLAGISEKDVSEFKAIMDKAMPQIAGAMQEIFSEEFLAASISPILEQYSEEQIGHIYDLVENPMYATFMQDMTVSLVSSPAYMDGMLKIGLRVDAILHGVFTELNAAKKSAPEAGMQEAVDRLFAAVPDKQ